LSAGTAAKHGEAEIGRTKRLQNNQQRQTQDSDVLLIADLSVQLAQATRKQDTGKIEKLAKNIDELESRLGPEYPALLENMWNMDPTSKNAKEIGSTLNKLDDFCGN
jgi:hypothetical protein